MKKFDPPPVYTEVLSGKTLHAVWVDWVQRVADILPIIQEISLTLAPTIIAANSTSQQSVTITGLKTGDTVLRVHKPTHTAGVFVTGGLVTAADTVSVQFANVTAGGITPPSEVYKFYVLRG